MSRTRSPEAAERKRAREAAVIQEMISLYCHGLHGTPKGSLCPSCAELLAYALRRVARCPCMETKTFCSQCRIHCYAPDMREKVREVMRYAGPRLLFRHPATCLHHGLDTLGARLRSRKIAKA